MKSKTASSKKPAAKKTGRKAAAAQRGVKQEAAEKASAKITPAAPQNSRAH